ncbi:MAG: hypothetical protein RLZZ436_1312, partial [Planctomycetota bacterium]
IPPPRRKTIKGSRNNSKARGPRHLVSLWMSAQGTTLAQIPPDAKSSEITAIPQVQELIDVRSAVITSDALGTRVGIVKAITERRGVGSASPTLFTRRLPPNGIGFLVFRMLWSTRSPLKRLDPIMQGVRSRSIGRYHPGALLLRRCPRGYRPLPGD